MRSVVKCVALTDLDTLHCHLPNFTEPVHTSAICFQTELKKGYKFSLCYPNILNHCKLLMKMITMHLVIKVYTVRELYLQLSSGRENWYVVITADSEGSLAGKSTDMLTRCQKPHLWNSWDWKPGASGELWLSQHTILLSSVPGTAWISGNIDIHVHKYAFNLKHIQLK